MSLQQWQQFLQASAQKKPISATSTLSTQDNVLCDLSHVGLLKLDGPDTVSFLQGQVTNDVKLLDGSNAHYTGYCTPKGRLLAIFLAFAHGGHLHLQMPKMLLDPITKRLKMYVLRSKVNIQDMNAHVFKFGIGGHHATKLLSKQFPSLPQQSLQLVTHANGTVIRMPGNIPRYEILSDIEHAQQLWTALADDCKTVNADFWEWLEIQAGIPEVYPDTQEAFVPQMLNLDLLNAINFKKGCYTGQEIVARTHYLGTVKRRTQHAQSSNFASIGTDVKNDQQEIVGKVVRCAQSPAGHYDLLIEIRLESLETGTVLVNNQPLVIKTLPYALQT
jgi:folate-binding protein YgfZ